MVMQWDKARWPFCVEKSKRCSALFVLRDISVVEGGLRDVCFSRVVDRFVFVCV